MEYQENEQVRYVSNSLVRGMEILRLFNTDHPTLSLTEIAKMLKVNRTIPFRLVYTLQQMGYLHQDETTKRYQLTQKIMQLGFAYLQSIQLPEVARPFLEKLRDGTGASAHLGILDGKEIVYIARVPARGVTSVNVTVGSRLPAHATAIGKTLLAYHSDAATLNQSFHLNELQSFTSQTKTAFVELKKELKQIREKGYAYSNGQFEIGIRSIAAPIFQKNGTIVAAVNVAASSTVLKDELLDDLIPLVVEAAVQLSLYYGYYSP